jgi:hypothetical protein
MTYKARVDTLRLLVDGHYILRSSSKLSLITGEMNRIIASGNLPKHNGWLLSVLHTTRTLDTVLSEIVMFKGWTANPPSLGSYLKALSVNGIIWPHERTGYESSIVRKRNKYMHEAGAMPNQLEADGILSEMHACMTVILGRV